MPCQVPTGALAVLIFARLVRPVCDYIYIIRYFKGIKAHGWQMMSALLAIWVLSMIASAVNVCVFGESRLGLWVIACVPLCWDVLFAIIREDISRHRASAGLRCENLAFAGSCAR
ncbi:hypothetical protein NLG97_g8566 [Lecanicillium saksenae]|uniref:Uncharacterized protein n=1 Tax=Lecanicillium saksenae TaxID=468837 RepID=A0ACC1QL68_9HYPO|nr:hypothetical protein NLG97_g8566 [Lecanicillium saksenae]